MMHIGKRIKLYRNARNMNIESLSQLIHKSKATVSKYERGQIAIDIPTLFEITHTLQIDISQLIDYEFPTKIPKEILVANPFDSNILYVYFFDGQVNRLRKSVIEVHNNIFEQKLSVMLYYDIASYEQFTNCEYFYYGTMQPYDTIINIILENQSNPIEKVMINIIRPLKKTTIWTGLLSGLSDIHVSPIAVKVVISKIILSNDENLNNLLLITKDELRMIKNRNAFIVSNFSPSIR
jgi:transcriptional regulator with XRE-family HTH domain